VEQTGFSLGADIGTTGCRLCLLSPTGRPVAHSHTPYEPERPLPDWAEQDANVWWDAFCTGVRRIAGKADLRRVRVVCVCGQSTALLPLDEAGRPLRKAIIWQDARSAPLCEEAVAAFGAARIRAVTGMPAATFLVWPKLLWFMRNEPDLCRRTRTFASANGYVTRLLSDRTVLDRSNAVGYPMALETREWWAEFCTHFGFPTEKIPSVLPSTSVLGRLTTGASLATGLPQEARVVAGGMDTACASLAVGATKPGRAFEVTGTSGGIGVVSAEPSCCPALGVTPHVLRDLYINHAPMSAAGASLTWFMESFCAEERKEAVRRNVSVYDVMAAEAAKLGDEPTGLLLLPYLAGERAHVWDDRARGALVGFGLNTTRAQAIKAVMEGVAYALRQNVCVMRRAGLHVQALRSCGGGSHSPYWCQLKADVLGIPIAVHGPERDAAFGAALLAGLATGHWGAEEMARQLAREQPTVYKPRAEVTRAYTPHFERYCALYPKLRDLF